MPKQPSRGTLLRACRALMLPAAIAYLLGVGIVVLAADRFWLLDLLTFAWPYIGAAGLVLLLAALATRRVKTIAVALAGAAVAAIPAIEVPTVRASDTAGGLKVLTANLFVENREEPAVFIDLLRREKPDIVVLQETRTDWEQALSASGLYPYESGAVNRQRLKVYSALPIRAETGLSRPFTERYAYKQPLRLELDLNGRPLFLYAFHPETPRRPWQWRDRNAYLSATADAVQGDLGKGPVIVAGDWNTPTWSPFFRGFLRQAGLASTAGGWLQPVTRFTTKLESVVYVGASIDHVAVSPDFSLRARRAGPPFGSNHLPIIVELSLPER